MEKVNKGVVFRICFMIFLVTFLFSVYFQSSDVPTFQELSVAIFEPFEAVADPLADFSDSLTAIADFIDGDGIPSLENLLNLFLAPFRMIFSMLRAVIVLIENLVGVFS